MIIVAGDFNIDLATDKENANTSKKPWYSTNIFSYTRELNGFQSLIDNIFTNIDQSVVQSHVLVAGISDHHAQVMDVTIKEIAVEAPKFVWKRLFSPQNISVFRCLIRRDNWTEVYTSKGVSVLRFKIVSYYVDIAFPLKKHKIRIVNLASKIDMHPSLLETR